MSDTQWKVARLADIERRGRDIPVREHLGIRAFGINAYTPAEDGTLISGHDESGSGQEELYLVLDGNARFEIDGETIDAPAGTFVFIRPEARRRATGDGTILAVGGTPGQVYEALDWGDAWSFHRDSMIAYGEQRYADAVEAVRAGLTHKPDHPGHPSTTTRALQRSRATPATKRSSISVAPSSCTHRSASRPAGMMILPAYATTPGSFRPFARRFVLTPPAAGVRWSVWLPATPSGPCAVSSTAVLLSGVRVVRATVEDAELCFAIARAAAVAGFQHVFPPERLRVPPLTRSARTGSPHSPTRRGRRTSRSRTNGAVGVVSVGDGVLQTLYVRPESWGRGIGSALHDLALGSASQKRMPRRRASGRSPRIIERGPSTRERGWRLTGRTRVVPLPPHPIDVEYARSTAGDASERQLHGRERSE